MKEVSALNTTAQKNAGERKERAREVGLGAFVLVVFLCGCSTNKPGVTAESKSAAPVLGAAAQADFAVDPAYSDAVHPWLALKSIGFFYNRADLSTWESNKVAEIVDYLARHPEAEVGINRPAVAPDGNPEIDDLNHRRIRTIINGLLTAGVSENRIHVGNFFDLPPTLDQRIEVLTRRTL